MSERGPTEHVKVSTPKELVYAVLDGYPHIVITAHLDLTTLPLITNEICSEGCSSPLPEIFRAESIRGDCVDPPTEQDLAVLAESPLTGAVALLPFQARQCLILAHDDALPNLSKHLWLDNLYLRMLYRNLPDERKSLFVTLAGQPGLRGPLLGLGAHYITRTTFQGDGLGPTVGVWADEAVYVENCTFANLGGASTGGCPDCSSAVNAAAVSVAVVNSTFFDIAPFPGAAYVRAWRGGRVLLSGCEFAPTPDQQQVPFYAEELSAVYADNESMLIRTDTDNLVSARPLSQAGVDHPNTSSTRFLRRDDPWFLRIRSVLNATVPPQPTYPAPTDPVPLLDIAPVNGEVGPDIASAGGGDSGGAPTAAIVGGVLGALAVALIVCAAVFLLRRRRKARLAEGAETEGDNAGKGGVSDPGGNGEVTGELAVTVGSHASTLASGKGRTLRSRDGRKAGKLMPAMPRGDKHPRSNEQAVLPQQEVVNELSAQGLLPLVHSQLDLFGDDDIIFAQFKLLGAPHRIQGSKSVLALAVSAYADVPCAIKFFPVAAHFKAELAVRKTPLGAFTPQILMAHDPARSDPNRVGTRDRHGRQLPPCIVMPRGENLQAWLDRAETDRFQAVSVLSHIAEALRDIHAKNYVHGHVKPAHILHLRQDNRWTLTDFDRAASVGCPVPPVATLEYTSPENMHAAASGAGAVPASPAADCWALGVVAFELLTNTKALKPSDDGAAAVEAQLLGQAELPWEGSRLDAATMRCLGVLHDLVLGLLRRDPEQRSTMPAFCNACLAIVASATTTAGQV